MFRPQSTATITALHFPDGYAVTNSDGDVCGRFGLGEESDACRLLLCIADIERGMDDEHWEAEQVAVQCQAADTKAKNRKGGKGRKGKIVQD